MRNKIILWLSFSDNMKRRSCPFHHKEGTGEFCLENFPVNKEWGGKQDGSIQSS